MDVSLLFSDNPVLKNSFNECLSCLASVSDCFKKTIKTPHGTPPGFTISSNGMPKEMFHPKRNIFSTLFYATYFLMDIPENRRMLYGKINYLFRIWVTSADNLLDHEDKETVHILMPEDSRIMRQVVAIMGADRVLMHIIDEALAKQVITQEEAQLLIDGTLEVLLPSAAEEACEEKGIIQRPTPGYVLDIIHCLKTHLLFYVPLLGPERMEKNIDSTKLNLCRKGLGLFGAGCQILDDVRDMARDYHEKRHNYILSILAHEYPHEYEKLGEIVTTSGIQASIFDQFGPSVYPALRLAQEKLIQSMACLDDAGLKITKDTSMKLSRYMFEILDVSSGLELMGRF